MHAQTVRPLDVFCDFDGTITTGDTIVHIMERLAHPSWREIENRWERGEIGSRETLALEVPLLAGGWRAVADVLSRVPIDRTFIEFARFCKDREIPLRIVSDGIDRLIDQILGQYAIEVSSVWSNHIIEKEGKLSMEFPHTKASDDCKSGICKCDILKLARPGALKVVIGDGRSDLCWAQHADLLFAKAALLSHCQEMKIDCIPFSDFRSIQSRLQQELQKPLPVSGHSTEQ